ncbi:MAG TPA: DUF3300 domain-containing protein, partial [Alphaproteobacteria bacterium]|nr:DUF3300 domain-containing protein [Alphaproteobacteria bacterium]
MKARLLRIAAGVLVLLLALATSGTAQVPPPPPGQAPPPPPGAAAPLLSPQQLDQMLASVALYPDPLLMEVLTAATYPLEVSQAAAWAQDPNNARLTGDALSAALANQDWDPSVKSLVPFPQVLQMMAGNLAWLQALGDAFVAQQSDVMDSVQRLRRAAQAAGGLASGPQESVVAADGMIEIEPANPQAVYLPCYGPGAYGTWPYADYPPIAVAPWSGCVPGPGIGFGVGFPIVPWLWGWGEWDWRNHHIHVDAGRFNRIDPRREHFSGADWTHDPAHRRGVPYRNPATTARFAPARANAPAPSRDIRGFPAGPPAAPPAAAPRAAVGPPRAPVAPRVAPPVAPAARAPSPAFAGVNNGANAKSYSVRGNQSLAAPPPRVVAPPPRAPAPPPRAAPSRAPA